MTSHPKDLSDELIEVMAESKKICPHLHLPLQSGSSRILKIMNRRYTKEQYLALTEKMREKMPDISLTTDIIVGFPGETEEDFQETLDVVRKVRYDSAFTFIYSRRTGTPAAVMENQVPEDVVKDRFDRLLALVQQIGKERSRPLFGADAACPGGTGEFAGRFPGNGPSCQQSGGAFSGRRLPDRENRGCDAGGVQRILLHGIPGPLRPGASLCTERTGIRTGD